MTAKQDNVQWIVEFTIKEGKLDAFKALVKEISSIVERNEPNAKSYQWFFNDDETKCVVTEWYSNQEAALAHLNEEGATKILPKLLETADVTRLEIYGDPGKEVKERLEKFGAKNFNFFAGFAR